MRSEHITGLAEADCSIADAEHNIRQLGSLLPELAINGYSTAEIEGQVEQMMQVLDYLRAQRHSIVTKLEAERPPAPGKRAGQGGSTASWRTLYQRLSRS